MPNIQSSPALPPEKPAQSPQALNPSKAQEACPAVPGKAVEASQSKSEPKLAGDSNQTKSAAQGSAKTSLSLDDFGKQLNKSQAHVDELHKAHQQADSAFQAKMAPLKEKIKQQSAELDKLWDSFVDESSPAVPLEEKIKQQKTELDKLWDSFVDESSPAAPDPELELINQIKDPQVRIEMLKQRLDRLSKELDAQFDLPEIKVLE